MSILIIAEAGVNHNGSKDLAFRLIEEAKLAGADIVKFQTFKTEQVVSKTIDQTKYQIDNLGLKDNQFNMLKQLELDIQTHFELQKHCNQVGIEFLSTAFDFESLNFLVKDLELKRLKIPSGELTNLPLLLEYATSGCDLILSTGMATLGEIENALGVLAFGLLGGSSPSLSAFSNAYSSKEGQKLLKEHVKLLHCTTEYPAPIREINLNAMSTLSSTFDLQVGYSDHSKGIVIPIAAAALGASIIEKHFTLDKTLHGPDHKVSLEPIELKKMVDGIRCVEICLGSSIKAPQTSEIKNKLLTRKKLVANKNLIKGHQLVKEDIAILRTKHGNDPSDYWDLVGKILITDVKKGEVFNV